MPVVISDSNKHWNKEIPYEIKRDKEVKLKKLIESFNAAMEADIFVPRNSQKDYVVFKKGGNSPLGKQGNPQELKVLLKGEGQGKSEEERNANVFHEMGHCCGLGHSFFHSKSQLHTLFGVTDTQAYATNLKVGYEDILDANISTMMAYSPSAFSNSPRILRIAEACGPSGKDNLILLKNDLIKLKTLLIQSPFTSIKDDMIPLRFRTTETAFKLVAQQPTPPPSAKPSLVKSFSGVSLKKPAPVPLGKPKFLEEGMKKIVVKVGEFEKIKVNSISFKSLIKEDLEQFIKDIDILKDYWVFDVGHMMLISDRDVYAVRSAVGLSMGVGYDSIG